MTSTDDKGFVKYWQANLNNVHTFQAHNDPVRSSRWGRCRMPYFDPAFCKFPNNIFLIILCMKNSSLITLLQVNVLI